MGHRTRCPMMDCQRHRYEYDQPFVLFMDCLIVVATGYWLPVVRQETENSEPQTGIYQRKEDLRERGKIIP